MQRVVGRPRGPAAAAPARPRITSPADGTTYKLVAGLEGQAVAFEAEGIPDGASAFWFVNGRHEATTEEAISSADFFPDPLFANWAPAMPPARVPRRPHATMAADSVNFGAFSLCPAAPKTPPAQPAAPVATTLPRLSTFANAMFLPPPLARPAMPPAYALAATSP